MNIRNLNSKKNNFKNKNKKIVRRKKGFTLIEIISVIIILGILSIITIPAVSKYIINSRETTYLAHERSMEEAANSMSVDCIAENNTSCHLPNDGEKTLIYLNELIDKGYLSSLRTSDGSSFCDEIFSYVEIENTGNSNYEFNACLYCGDYVTDNANCTSYSNDNDNPVCGKITGESTQWTNQDRTIFVGCSDATSGCLKSEFSKTFKNTTQKGTVQIADKSGNSVECPVDVYVDKDIPTCELEVVSGTMETTGWYSGDVEVRLKSTNDLTSGVLTYGIGTSINNKNYNKENTIKIVNHGTTTVIGYVKDYAGNEGVCSLDVRVGAPKPTFNVEYGYQIYPDKEKYVLNNITENGTILTTQSSDSSIELTGLSNYKNVNRVVVYFNNIISTTTTGQIFYTNTAFSDTASSRALLAAGKNSVEFIIPKGTYNSIKINLGTVSGASYNIKKIELRVGDSSSLYTNKNVSINIVPTNEVVKTTEFSFDNGNTWQNTNYKDFSNNYSGIVKSRNKLPLTSEPVNVKITNIDKLVPSCVLKADGTKATSDFYGTNVNISFQSVTDAASTSLYSMSNVNKYGLGSVDGSKTLIMTEDNTEGVTYTGYVEDKAGNIGTCSIVVKRKANWTLTYNNNGGTGCTNKVVVYNNQIGTLCTPTKTGYTFAGWYSESSLTNRITNTTIFKNEYKTLYAKWTANKYTLTYNANGGSVSPTSKTVTYDATYGTLPTPTRAGYSFKGWYTAASGGTQVTTTTVVKTSSNHTIYAQWTQCGAGTYSTGSTCQACPSGTYSTGGAASCTNCPDGYTTWVGAVSLNSCYIDVSAGKYIATANSATQSSCPAGTYSNKHRVVYGSTSSCTRCPSGTYSTGGASSCSTCGSGYKPNSSQTGCERECSLHWVQTNELYLKSCSGNKNGSSSKCGSLSTSGYSVGATYTICSSKVFCRQSNGNYCYGTNSSCSCYPTKNRYRKITCTLVCD